MTVAEKVSYIKGLAEGLGVDDSTKEGKVLAAIVDVLDDIALTLGDIDEELNDVADVMTDMEESVDCLEDVVYGDEEDDFCWRCCFCYGYNSSCCYDDQCICSRHTQGLYGVCRQFMVLGFMGL